MQRDITEILVTKLCHDLAASIGAIYNGVEFLQMEEHHNLENNKAFELIVSNSKIAADKLKFFRYIYGWVETDGEVDNKKLEELTDGFFHDTKIKAAWRNEQKGENYVHLRHKAAKLVLLLTYIGSSLLLHGGEILIELNKLPHGKSISISGIANKQAKVDEEIQNIMDGIAVEPTVHNIAPQMAYSIKKEIGVPLEFKQSEGGFNFKFEFV